MSKWEWKKLKDVCVFIGDGDWIESKDQSSKGIRLIQTGNIGNGIYLDKKERSHYISETTFCRLHCTEIFPGDCLISRLPEPIGRACVIPDIAEKMITAVDCTIVRFCEFFAPNFFIYYAQSEKYFSDVKSESTGATRKRISRKNLENIKIPIPPLSEQKRIVKFLDEEFSKIDTLKINAETNLKNAKELFETTLEKELNPLSRHSERSEESSAELPSGWELKALGDVCEILSDLINPTEEKYLNMYHVGGANIESETGRIIDLKTSEEEGLTSGKFVFDDSVVLYNKIRPYLKKVARPNFAGICSADMYPLSPKNGMLKDFLYYILIASDFTDYAIKHSDRAGMPKLNRKALFVYEFPLPPLSVQKEIVARLDKLSENVKRFEANYKQIIANCDELKKSILKKTFEGES